MKESLNNKTIIDIKMRVENLERRNIDFKILKDKLEKYFNFKITNYIIDDIIEKENYNHFCLMVNMSVLNNGLSNENGEILKVGIKELYNIKNMYDKFL